MHPPDHLRITRMICIAKLLTVAAMSAQQLAEAHHAASADQSPVGTYFADNLPTVRADVST